MNPFFLTHPLAARLFVVALSILIPLIWPRKLLLQTFLFSQLLHLSMYSRL